MKTLEKNAIVIYIFVTIWRLKNIYYEKVVSKTPENRMVSEESYPYDTVSHRKLLPI